MRKVRSDFVAGVLAIAGLCFVGIVQAEVPPPCLSVSFDDGYGVEGKLADVTFNIPYDKIPKENIVPGIRGKGVVPLMNVLPAETNNFLDCYLREVQGVAGDIKIKYAVPAPEGTISVWCKPVAWSKLAGEGQKGYGAQANPRGYVFRVNWGGPSEEYVIMVESDTYWRQGWLVGGQMIYAQGPGVFYKKLWNDDQWRMFTLVYRNGERTMFVDDYCAGTSSGIDNNPDKPGDFIALGAGSKVFDKLTVWDKPLSAAEVAMLYYSEMPRINEASAACLVPTVNKAATVDGKYDSDVYDKAATIGDWCDSFAGSAVPARDEVKLAVQNGVLYVLYREPMPTDYEVAKNILGGTMTSSKVKANDGPVWQGDSVELLLSPDSGKTTYRLIFNAAGARYDAKNGDTTFTSGSWKAASEENAKYWTVEFSVPLKELAGAEDVKKWGFNIIRNVRLQGFAKRQWCYLPGDEKSLGVIEIAGSVPDIAVKSVWDEATGTWTLGAQGAAAARSVLDYALTPLVHQKLFPEDKVLNEEFDLKEGAEYPVAIAAKIAPASEQKEIPYSARKAALAAVKLITSDGAVQYAHSALIAAQSAFDMAIVNLPTKDLMLAEITLPGKKMVGAGLSAVVTLKAKGADKPFAVQKIPAFNAITGQAEFNVKDLPPGPIVFTAEIMLKDKKTGEIIRDFYHSGKPVWWDKRVGVMTNVPAPWKPIVVKGSTAELHLKKFDFADGLFPKQINIMGEDILAGPMKLVVKSGGKTIDTSGVVVKMNADKSGLKATINGEKATDKFVITQDGFVEYDGFLWSEITITPKAEMQFDEIYFEAPFKKEYAQVFNGCPVEPLFLKWPSAVPEKGMETERQWCVRLGSVERGIQFSPVFSKYPEEKLVVNGQNPLKITPAGDAMVFKYKVLDVPLVRSKPIKLEIGIFALPVKEYDRRQRKIVHGGSSWHWDQMVSSGAVEKGYRLPYYYGAGWTGHGPGGMSEDEYYHLTEKSLDAISAAWQEEWKKYHWFTCCYVSPTCHDATTREYAYFQDEWRAMPSQEHLDETKYLAELKDWNGTDRPGGAKLLAAACWADKGVQDYWMYCIDKAMKNFHRNGLPIGIYVDNVGLYWCSNPYHNHGYVDDEGNRRGKWEFLGHREWTKRFANVMKSADPEAHIVIHMSNFRVMGIWSMVDILYEGEQFTAAWDRYIADKPELNFNDCYPTIMPLDRFRAEFAKQLYGVDATFFSQLWVDSRQNENINDNSNKQRLAPSRRMRYRHLSGLAWVHDTPISGELEPIETYFKLIKWGWDEKVEFIGYWNTRDAYTLETSGDKEIAASVWYRPEGKLAAMIFNGTNKPQKTTLKINAAKFPVKLNNFTKALDISRPDDILDKGKTQNEEFSVQDLAVTVDMRPRDYRFLIFE